MKKILILVLILAVSMAFSNVHSDNSEVMTKILVVPDAKPTLNLDITANKGEWGKYSFGEKISFSLESDRTAKVAVIGINIDGQLALLLPNNYDSNNQVYGNSRYYIPRQGYSYEIDTQKSGTEHVVVYGTRNHGYILDSLINSIQSGQIRNFNQLGQFLKSNTQNLNGDWNSDTVSYYCNYQPAQPASARTVILSIGISDYLHIDDLPSPAKDATDFAALMKDKYGIKSSDIIVLTDSAASKSGITAAFNKVLNKIDSNTTLIIFYSGHGGQLEDNNGDETDGKDELICPYDFSSRIGRSTAIMDDDLSDYIRKFSSKSKECVMIFDSCFSGSAQKALVMKNDGWNAVQSKTSNIGGLGAENGAKALDSKNISNFVFLAASKGSEASRDTGAELGYSLYTYFLLKGLNGAADTDENGKITSLEIHNYISKGILELSEAHGNTYYQTPQIDPNVNITIAR